MKAIVNVAPGRVEWQDWPLPEPGVGQARIRTAACGVCATDLEMIAGWNRTGFPAIPGHEWSGVVDAVGSAVDPALLGKLCVAENVLSDGGEVGFEHPGGYGQFLVTEARNLYPLPQNFPPATAALIEPLAVCVRALGRLRLEDRSSALILGDGAIGLLMLLLLKAKRVDRVVLVGGRPGRLNMARELHAAAVLNYHEAGPDLAGAIAALPGAPFPNVVEASGSPAAIHAALGVAARGGKILIVGDYGPGCASFLWNRILLGELELIGSNASAGAWPEAVRLATSGALPLERLVSRRLPATAYAEALETARKSKDVVKVVMEWGT
jgi:2-desacetyl-2-hydroxyethyl bacteriochlorophyllide A dehydrogenase